MRKIDVDKLTNVNVSGVDTRDYPDFVDAYIDYAELDDVPLTDEELDYVNTHHTDFVYDAVRAYIF